MNAPLETAWVPDSLINQHKILDGDMIYTIDEEYLTLLPDEHNSDEDSFSKEDKCHRPASKFSAEIKTHGLYRKTDNALIWECEKCPPEQYFSSIIDYICHSIQLHTDMYNYQCNACKNIISDNALMEHLPRHDVSDISIFLKGDEDYFIEEYLEEYYEPTQESGKDVEATNVEEDSDAEPADIVIDSKIYRKLLWDGRETLIEKILDPDGRILYKCEHCLKVFDKLWGCAMHLHRCARQKKDRKRESKQLCSECGKNKCRRHNESCDGSRNSTKNKTICEFSDNSLKSTSQHRKSSCLIEVNCCGTLFNTLSSFNMHSSEVHSSEIQICKRCKKIHNSTEECIYFCGKQIFLCAKCGIECLSAEELKKHDVKMHGVQCYQPKCHKRFATQEGMMKHAQKEHLPRVKCPKNGCSRRYIGKSKSFHEHVEKCYKIVKKNGNHTPRQKRRELFYCKHCNKGLQSLDGLNKHSEQCGSNYSRVAPCEHCGIPFKNEQSQKDHVEKLKCYYLRESLNKTISYYCYRCSVNVSSRAAYYVHYQSVHPGLGPHQCNICEDSQPFAKYQGLIGHMNKHAGRKPYKCQFCGKEYANYFSLAAHRNHSHVTEWKAANKRTT